MARSTIEGPSKWAQGFLQLDPRTAAAFDWHPVLTKTAISVRSVGILYGHLQRFWLVAPEDVRI